MIPKAQREQCVFYAGKVGFEADVMRKRNERDYMNGYKILKETWITEAYVTNTVNAMTGGSKKVRFNRFFRIASRVLAEDCAGTTYVFLPKGTGSDWSDPIFQGSIWKDQEWPALSANGAVSQVIRLDWDDASHKDYIKGSASKRAVAAIEARDQNDKCKLYPRYRICGSIKRQLALRVAIPTMY
jgi:hypothetical protein